MSELFGCLAVSDTIADHLHSLSGFNSLILCRSGPLADRLEWLENWKLGQVGSASCYHSNRSEEHTSELQSRGHLVCRLLLEKKKLKNIFQIPFFLNQF